MNPRQLPLLALLLIAACTTTPPRPDARDWEMTGKISVVTARERQVMGVRWRQSGDESDIALTGPLGMRIARIEAMPGEILIDTGRETHRLSPADTLHLEDFSAIRLPWQHLRSWIRGKTQDGEDIGEEGIEEADWQVRVVARGPTGPEILTVQHPAIQLRLKVQKWRLNSP